MDQVILYDNQYYIVQLEENGEQIELDENCIQYIAIDGEKSEEENLDVNYDTVEEVVACVVDETDNSTDEVAISNVYSEVDNNLQHLLKKEGSVIVEKIPTNENHNEESSSDKLDTDLCRQNLNIVHLNETDDITFTKTENVIENDSIESHDSSYDEVITSDKKDTINSHVKDKVSTHFECIFVSGNEQSDVKEGIQSPHAIEIVNSLQKSPPKRKNAKSLVLEDLYTEEVSDDDDGEVKLTIEEEEETPKVKTSTLPAKRKRGKTKENPNKKLKPDKKVIKPKQTGSVRSSKRKIQIESPEDIAEPESPNKIKKSRTTLKGKKSVSFKKDKKVNSSQKDLKSEKKVAEEVKPTRKSSRQSIRKGFPDDEETTQKKDFRALTRVVFAPKKDKTVANQKVATKSNDRRRNAKAKAEGSPKANLKDTAGVQRNPGNRYRCKLCPNSYDVASSYYNHVRNIHGKDSNPVGCEYCPGIFKNRDSLLRHLRLYHTGPDAGKMHLCHICDAKYNLKGGLVSHLKNVHDKEDKALVDALKKCVKITENTSKTVTSNDTVQKRKSKKVFKKMKMEMSSLDMRKQFPCHICGARFTQKSSMYRHVRLTHKNKGNMKDTDDVYIKCKLCSNSFISKQSLAKHCTAKHRSITKYGGKNKDKNIKNSTVKCNSKFLSLFK